MNVLIIIGENLLRRKLQMMKPHKYHVEASFSNQTTFGPPDLWSPYARIQATTKKKASINVMSVRSGGYTDFVFLLLLFSKQYGTTTILTVIRFYREL